MDAYTRRRVEMVEKQIIGRGIRDELVIEVMREIPRHLFVDEALQDKGYGDFPIPIGEKQTISQPYMVAVMTEMLELTGSEKVLEIGSGSGYQTAVLSRLAEKVYSVERIPQLLIRARQTLEKLEYHNVALKIADGTLGWKDYAPYDAIIVTAGSPEIPKSLVDQLAMGGRMVIPIGDEEKQILHKLVKTKLGVRESVHTKCTFVKLIGQYGWKETSVP
jgi:protein-L-isoaspartate(D-aspartate) O-methyltransferase